MMETYHKIHAPYHRYMEGENKGKLILGRWTRPEFEYLQDNEWEWTEKVDGTNIRVHLTRVNDEVFIEYAGRSDSALIPTRLLEYLEATFPTYPGFRRDIYAPSYVDRYVDLVDWMIESGNNDVILFGEGYGPKIQGGGKYRTDDSFVLFDVKIGDYWLKRDDVNDVADHLGIDAVPVIGYGTLHDAIDYVSLPMQSTWGDFTAEGLVIRPRVTLFDRRGDRVITKVKVRDFV